MTSPPTIRDYVVRVGGLALIFVVAITLCSNYWPGYEGPVVLLIAGVVLTYTFVMYLAGRS